MGTHREGVQSVCRTDVSYNFECQIPPNNAVEANIMRNTLAHPETLFPSIQIGKKQQMWCAITETNTDDL